METVDIIDELKQNFVDSSYDVNSNRAFPDARDGLKPGQRACLWEMYSKGYTHKKPHVKSAKVSGGVIANWWPHSDVAIYETFARMAQDFTNNIPEVDFHGAYGNIILGGDAIANQRYTESRLSAIVEEGMLQGLNKNAVNMIWNFSEDEQWPEVFPAIFPRLLVNGAEGIGVSIANKWLPHSFSETSNLIINYLKNGIVDNENYQPSFPTGGVIVNKEDLVEINTTGRGKVILEAKYNIIDNCIDFYEMPYQAYIEDIIAQIKSNIEKNKINNIVDISNRSDLKHISLMIECTSNKVIPSVLEELFTYTDLRKQINANQRAVVNKTPVLLTLEDMCRIYKEHNTNCIKREFEFEFEKTLKRLDIIHGLIIAHNHIDEVIKIIREDEQPKAKLVLRFDLNETQVNAILDMRLARLSKLDLDKLLQEQEEKVEYSKYCKKVVESEEEQKQILIQRLSDLATKYGDKRRTEVIQKDIIKAAKIKKETIIESVVVAITEDGYIKNIPVAQYRASNKNKAFIKTTTDQLVILFSNLGKMYRVKVSKIKSCGSADKGQAGGALLKLEANERIIGCAANNDEGDMLIVTSNNLIRRTPISSFSSTVQSLNGLKYYPIQDNEVITCVVKIFTKDDTITVRTKTHALKFLVEEVTCTKSKTSKGMKCMNTQELIVSAILNEQNNLPLGKRTGVGKKI